MVCRDAVLREGAIRDLKGSGFAGVHSYKVPEEINEVLYCSPHKRTTEEAIEAAAAVNRALMGEVVDVAESMGRLRVA